MVYLSVLIVRYHNRCLHDMNNNILHVHVGNINNTLRYFIDDWSWFSGNLQTYKQVFDVRNIQTNKPQYKHLEEIDGICELLQEFWQCQ